MKQDQVVEYCAPGNAPEAGIPSFAGGEMTAGEVLRYLAEAAPERVWLQLSLEQVPIKGTP
ncbi:hypothetical protein [Collimonas fungivorans]|uniref:hypothetical protein n=1 Tax=Collimonas fungivorans TaxID=158899 RepID=UPI0011D2B2A3|nr:hypothetical protein [Collimonas fungivorans]